MDDILSDKRFAHVAKDPRFRRIPTGERKVKIDSRFKGMFDDKRFKLKYSVDKRGKPTNLTTNENLKKYYELSDEDSSESEDEDVNESDNDSDVTETVTDKSGKGRNKQDAKKFGDRKNKDKKVKRPVKSSDESDSDLDLGKQGNVPQTTDPRFQTSQLKNIKAQKTVNAKGQTKTDKLAKDVELDDEDADDQFDSDESSDEEVQEGSKPKGNDSGVDFARGEGNIVSSSSDEDDDSDDASDDADDKKDVSKFDHKWGEADDNIVPIEDATTRLAVCNMDWDRVKANDIFVLLNSFKPADGVVKSVRVYPSEYGKERMAEEAAHGPRELKEMKLDSDDEEEQDEDMINEEGTSYHREKLREYQLNRLKYYYAVVECDCVATADHIYKECDGMEYETSSTKLDLRFIPEEETFNEAEASSVCTSLPVNYKPKIFYNAALSQSKVDFTWDETDRDRVQLTTQQFTGKGDEAAEEDLKAYLASSSDEEGPDYGALIEQADEDDSGEESDEDKKINKYKMLLSDIDSQEQKKKLDVQMEISWEPGLREATENIVKKKKQSKNSTVWQDYLERKKEKKKEKIEERKKKKQGREQQPSEDEQSGNDEDIPEEGMQAFSDDEIPVDDDMAAFMAEARAEDDKSNKKKKNKKKKTKKEAVEEETEKDKKEKAELSLLMMDGEDNKKHFSIQDLIQDDGKKKKKNKQKGEKNKDDGDEFKVNVSDPRFSAVYESHLYNIDPSAPEYRKTKGTEAMISEKIKRSGKRDRNNRNDQSLSARKDDVQAKKMKMNDNQASNKDNLASLVKSVKSKTKHFQSNRSIKR